MSMPLGHKDNVLQNIELKQQMLSKIILLGTIDHVICLSKPAMQFIPIDIFQRYGKHDQCHWAYS
jgi:hypothetical protein